MSLPPLRFEPRFVAKMWGGQTLRTALHKPISESSSIGESWELFDFPPGVVGEDGRAPGDDPDGWTSARVASGEHKGKTLHELMQQHPRELLGSAGAVATDAGEQFPLLIKFLDARQDLSVQVHPSAEYAKAHRDAKLKNECWHVLTSEPGARLLIGVRENVSKSQFEASLREGSCESKLNSVPVKVGETYYLPSGTVHALGAGILAAEVQTPSDTTYRVYDFDRVDPKSGKKRGLHIEPAMENIDFSLAGEASIRKADVGTRGVVVDAPQFTLEWFDTSRPLDSGKCVVIIALSNGVRVGDVTLEVGQTLLVSADCTAKRVEIGEGGKYLLATPS